MNEQGFGASCHTGQRLIFHVAAQGAASAANRAKLAARVGPTFI
jgi:hypothetical protein